MVTNDGGYVLKMIYHKHIKYTIYFIIGKKGYVLRNGRRVNDT